MTRPPAPLTALILSLGLTGPGAFGQNPTADGPAGKPDATPKPPAGWAEFSPKDGTFMVWVPEKSRSRRERERTSTVRGHRLKVHALAIETGSGPTYVAEELLISAALARQFKPGELSDLFRDMVASEGGGKLTDETDVKAGTVVGKEYRFESARGATRARIFVAGGRVLIVRVVGRKAQVEDEAADTFLGSARFAAGSAAGPAGRTPTILGGAFDPEFKDVAPDGGLLVGFEVGFGESFGREMIRAVRPIYRAGGRETVGEQYGTQLAKLVTLKARDGYAVGAIAVKHGLGFDGMSVTFMKVVDGKLDPKDSYESEFVGSDENKTPTKMTGAGVPAVGIVGKSNDKDMTGMGLLFKGQTFEPKKK